MLSNRKRTKPKKEKARAMRCPVMPPLAGNHVDPNFKSEPMANAMCAQLEFNRSCFKVDPEPMQEAYAYGTSSFGTTTSVANHVDPDFKPEPMPNAGFGIDEADFILDLFPGHAIDI